MASERDPKFYAELKQLNEDLIDYLKRSQDLTSFFDFRPTVISYVKHLDELEGQFPPKVDNGIKPQPPPPLSTATVTPITTTVTDNKNLSTWPFEFKLPEPQKFGTFSFGNTTFNTSSDPFGVSAKAAESNAVDDDNEVSAPPEPNLEKFQETDFNFNTRTKLYERTKKPNEDWTLSLLGLGQLYIKSHTSPDKIQVIVRQEPDLKKILLNQLVTKGLPVKLVPKAVQLVVPSQDGETKCYIFKLTDDKVAKELYQSFQLVK